MTSRRKPAKLLEMACKWSEDEDGNWFTGCGEAFIIIDGKPSDNGMKFCCYCGKLLKEVPYTESEL